MGCWGHKVNGPRTNLDTQCEARKGVEGDFQVPGPYAWTRRHCQEQVRQVGLTPAGPAVPAQRARGWRLSSEEMWGMDTAF